VKYQVTVGGREVTVEIEEGARGGRARVAWEGGEATVDLHAAEGLEALAELAPEPGSRAASRVLRVRVAPIAGGGDRAHLRFLAGNRLVEARVESERDRLRSRARPGGGRSGPATLRSTLPGVIRRILLRPGDPVAEGTPVLTLEAMKMENEVRAEGTGKVRAILVREGQVVNTGEPLAEIEAG
jgi:biotin carboxyl carrier protein